MSEPLVLINLFSMPPAMVDDFVANWEVSTAPVRGAKGFRGTRLHRALDANAHYPVVNIARWDSVEDWEAAVGQHFPRASADPDGSTHQPQRDAAPISAQPALYTVVHVTPDPQDRPSEQPEPGRS